MLCEPCPGVLAAQLVASDACLDVGVDRVGDGQDPALFLVGVVDQRYALLGGPSGCRLHRFDVAQAGALIVVIGPPQRGLNPRAALDQLADPDAAARPLAVAQLQPDR